MSACLVARGMDTDEPSGIAMQTRCIWCLGEQYVLNVIAFSNGESGCTRCGRFTTPLTYEQWYAALRDARAKLT